MSASATVRFMFRMHFLCVLYRRPTTEVNLGRPSRLAAYLVFMGGGGRAIFTGESYFLIYISTEMKGPLSGWLKPNLRPPTEIYIRVSPKMSKSTGAHKLMKVANILLPPSSSRQLCYAFFL